MSGIRPNIRWLLLIVATAALALGGAAWWWTRPNPILQLAQDALAARDYGQARTLLDQYLAAHPGDASAQLLAARACRRLRDYDAAQEHLRRCGDAGGDAAAIEVESALIGVHQGVGRSVPWLRERAQKEDELALVILEALIQYDIDTYRLRQAQHDLTEFLRRRPDDLNALLLRGYVWERFLSFVDAAEDYRKAVAAHPDSVRARLRLAEALLLAGTPAEALEQYQWLAERWPERPEVKLGQARCRRQLGEMDAAEQLLEALLANDPRHGEALLERGLLALDRTRPGEAEPVLRRAYAAIPFDRRVSYSLERCLTALDRSDEAEKFRRLVAQLDADVRRLDHVRHEVMKRPEDAALRSEAGILFLRNGEREEGIRWLKMALRLDPNCEAARQALASAGQP